MTIDIGYIYIRIHFSYDMHNACKMGITINIPERDCQYATGEIKRGYFETVFEVSLKKMKIVERLLQNNFCDLNIKLDGGTEFYNKRIIELIEPYLIQLGIRYRRLTKEEIKNLIRINRVKNSIKKINIKSLISVLKTTLYVPRKVQIPIIQKSIEHLTKNDKGILALICATGKTLISLWIAQKLKANTIFIGVPNILLFTQWRDKVRHLFQDIPCLLVYSCIKVETIQRFLEKNHKCIIITTYASAYKVYSACQYNKYVFDMKINDEAHHLTSSNMCLENTTKKYIKMLDIPSIKQLSLTATLKQIEGTCDDNVISNDNIEYFGKIIDRKCLSWAIHENIVCDYVIQTIITDEEQIEQQFSKFNITNSNDKKLFLSAFASLKSIFDEHSHHLLIYANNKHNALKLMQYIKMLLDDKYFYIPELYYSYYHSEIKSKTQTKILNNFNKAKFGIISCVYCLGEGYDNYNIDAVVFSENMTSIIRIVQSALRAIRKDKNNPNKKAKIILPILSKDDWVDTNDNIDLKKVRDVIYLMGLEDVDVDQKIKVYKINIEKHDKKHIKEKTKNVDEFGEYDDEFTQKLKLKTIKRTEFSLTYEQARKINFEHNIKNKKDYYALCEKHNRLPKDPWNVFKNKFTWIEYLNIDRIYYDLDTCKNKVREYISLYPVLKKHYLDLLIITCELCRIDQYFPPYDLWIEYYNVNDLRDIISITTIKKKMGALL